MNIKYWEEEAKKRNKVLLIENYSVFIESSQIEKLKETKLIESSDGDKYKARYVIKNVPVSKFTENLNGRIYPRELDEKIIKEGIITGTYLLMAQIN